MRDAHVSVKTRRFDVVYHETLYNFITEMWVLHGGCLDKYEKRV